MGVGRLWCQGTSQARVGAPAGPVSTQKGTWGLVDMELGLRQRCPGVLTSQQPCTLLSEG